LNFSKKYLLLVEIPVFCSNIEILDFRELSIIFATKIDNSITQIMAKLLIIYNDYFRYINTSSRIAFNDADSIVVQGRLCSRSGQLCGIIRKYGLFLRDSFPPCNRVFKQTTLGTVTFVNPKTGQNEGPVMRQLVGGSFLYFDTKPDDLGGLNHCQKVQNLEAEYFGLIFFIIFYNLFWII
jgi:hypothetical protein